VVTSDNQHITASRPDRELQFLNGTASTEAGRRELRMNPPHISVCICTYRRPDLLQRTLNGLRDQETAGAFTYSVVVVDNDEQQSGRPVVETYSQSGPLPIVYCVEPVKNISLARNRALSVADGEFVAILDDDEFPSRDWLLKMLQTLQFYGVAGVQGPVRAHFDGSPPRWLRLGKFHERWELQMGVRINWRRGRTANMLFRRNILQDIEEPFRAEFGSGGEDQDFLRRLIERSHNFVFCSEGIVYEVIPPARWKRSFLLKQAFDRGRAAFQLRSGKITKSLVAVSCYSLSLPFSLLRGHHVFMKYLVNLCNHLGYLLAVLRLNPVRDHCS